MCRVQYPSQEQQCWYWGVLSRNQIAAPEIIPIAYSNCSDPSEMAIESMECSHSSDSTLHGLQELFNILFCALLFEVCKLSEQTVHLK